MPGIERPQGIWPDSRISGLTFFTELIIPAVIIPSTRPMARWIGVHKQTKCANGSSLLPDESVSNNKPKKRQFAANDCAHDCSDIYPLGACSVTCDGSVNQWIDKKTG